MEFINIADVDWRTDSITNRYITENYAQLMRPGTMTVYELATAARYCTSIDNPYSQEICWRAGLLESFKRAATDEERNAVLRTAANIFRMRPI